MDRQKLQTASREMHRNDSAERIENKNSISTLAEKFLNDADDTHYVPYMVKKAILDIRLEDPAELQKRLKNLVENVLKRGLDDDIFKDLFLMYCYRYARGSPAMLYKLEQEAGKSFESDDKIELMNWINAKADKGALAAVTYMKEHDKNFQFLLRDEKTSAALICCKSSELVLKFERVAQMCADAEAITLLGDEGPYFHDFIAANQNWIKKNERLTGKDVYNIICDVKFLSNFLVLGNENPHIV